MAQCRIPSSLPPNIGIRAAAAWSGTGRKIAAAWYWLDFRESSFFFTAAMTTGMHFSAICGAALAMASAAVNRT